MTALFYHKNIGRLDAENPPTIRMMAVFSSPEAAEAKKRELMTLPGYLRFKIEPLQEGDLFGIQFCMTPDEDFVERGC